MALLKVWHTHAPVGRSWEAPGSAPVGRLTCNKWGDGGGSALIDGGKTYECMGCRKDLENPMDKLTAVEEAALAAVEAAM